MCQKLCSWCSHFKDMDNIFNAVIWFYKRKMGLWTFARWRHFCLITLMKTDVTCSGRNGVEFCQNLANWFNCFLYNGQPNALAPIFALSCMKVWVWKFYLRILNTDSSCQIYITVFFSYTVFISIKGFVNVCLEFTGNILQVKLCFRIWCFTTNRNYIQF